MVPILPAVRRSYFDLFRELVRCTYKQLACMPVLRTNTKCYNGWVLRGRKTIQNGVTFHPILFEKVVICI